MKEYFVKDLVDIAKGGENQTVFFSSIFEKLIKKGYVKETFLKALDDREKKYPTGLQTPFYGVAIPHTDPVHINKPFIYMIKLEQPIKFGQMGTNDEFIDVYYSFVLGFQKGKDQLVLLQQLMKMFSDEDVMLNLYESNTVDDIFKVVKNYYK